MLQRVYPGFVSLLGGIGLGLALSYFVGVGLVLVEGMEDWALFFSERAVVFLLPPYLMLVAHMVLRNHVGRFLLSRRAYEEAAKYSEKRAGRSLVRSRRELANHRVVWARALIGLGRYEEAEELLQGRQEKLPGSYGVEARRWLMELALRRDDRERARELTKGLDEKTRKARGSVVGGLRGCEAELALRESDLELYQKRMMAALWSGAGTSRVGLSRVLARIDHEESGEDDEEILATLELLQGGVSAEIPAREAEIDALRAWILYRGGQQEEAQALLTGARKKVMDPWTEQVIEVVQKRLDS